MARCTEREPGARPEAYGTHCILDPSDGHDWHESSFGEEWASQNTTPDEGIEEGEDA